MQAKWWHGIAVLGLCVVSYTLGRTHAGTQAPEPPAVVQQDAPGRTVDAPGLPSWTQIPATPREPQRTVARAAPDPRAQDAPVAAQQQVTTRPATQVSNNPSAETASRTIDDAVSRRVWTNDDARAFRQAIVDIPAEERDRLIRQLTIAINSGELTVMVDRGPPF